MVHLAMAEVGEEVLRERLWLVAMQRTVGVKWLGEGDRFY